MREVHSQEIPGQRVHTTTEAVLAAWREQLAAAARQPLAGEVLEARSRELWPRFARFYETLQALPRRRRRALQRRLGQTLAAVALCWPWATSRRWRRPSMWTA